ncbi:hypothetical protein JCM10914A_24320 [Paenibacillus sp. JCM 10914]|uniref:hypothetical protein n=1 Tax=Paenibacillus sp. JCM 10914 TaxID=1236974 RepID=UPI0003CC4693|nr:hypothetical protein [Paenibacillus sp. JCM 10914]GAE06105.1 hypothetical protein JCM10914_2247 [Paenibacillus sp. JCM 10914]
MKRTGILALLSLMLLGQAWLGWGSEPVHALSCAPPRAVTEEVADSDIVFRGTLVSTQDHRLVDKFYYTFEVTEWWKGDSKLQRIDIYSNGWDTFEKGKEYVVFADADDIHKPKAHLCGNTGPVAGVDVASLGEGAKPGSTGEETEQGETGTTGGKSMFARMVEGFIHLIRLIQGSHY